MRRSEPDILHRTRVAVICLVSLLMLGLVGSAVVWRMRLSHTVESQLTALRAAGLPTSGAELNNWYATVPDSENAALVMTQAFALMRTFPDQRSNEVSRFKPPPRGQRLTSEQVKLISNYVTLNADALETARAAVKLPKSRYPIELDPGVDALLPHLGKIKTLVQIARDKAILAIDAQQGPDATPFLITTLGLARTLDLEPLLISQLVRISILRTTREILELRLNAGNIGGSELNDLTPSFASAERTNLMVRALAGEQAMVIPYFHMTRSTMGRLAKTDDDDSSAVPPMSKGEPGFFRVTGFFELDQRFYLRVMRSNMALAELGPSESLAATNLELSAEAGVLSRHYILSGLFLPAMSRAVVKEAQGLASARICAVALALERFRLANERLPKELSELVPRFLPTVPLDPFDGAPLRYKPLAKGYVIYSIGPDGRDDGGKEPPSRRPSTKDVPEDITLTVER